MDLTVWTWLRKVKRNSTRNKNIRRDWYYYHYYHYYYYFDFSLPSLHSILPRSHTEGERWETVYVVLVWGEMHMAATQPASPDSIAEESSARPPLRGVTSSSRCEGRGALFVTGNISRVCLSEKGKKWPPGPGKLLMMIWLMWSLKHLRMLR